MTDLDNFKWQPSIDKLAPVVKEAQQKLCASDRAVVAARSGAAIDQQGHLYLEFLWHEYVIDHAEWAVKRASDGATPPSLLQGLLLTYLYTSDGTPLTNRMIGFRELPDGLFYAQAFQGYTGDELVRALDGDLARFQGACERLAGAAISIGDAGYAFRIFPQLTLSVAMWTGDEDFPAQAQVLFDANAPHHLPTEALAIVGSLLIGQVVKAAK